MKPKLIFSDFDGTLTYRDQLTPLFFEILSLLKKNNIELVIATGRSKSWGHFLLSHFHDFNHIITEGGGMLSGVTGTERKLYDRCLIDHNYPEKLKKLTSDLLKKFPNVELSIDSFGRECDRAIELDFLNQHPRLRIEIENFFKEQEVNYSCSHIHMNFWFGDISKDMAMDKYLEEFTDYTREEVLFFGDSLNDEPVFATYPHCVGVSNIAIVIDKMKAKPSVILNGTDNEGPMGVMNYLSQLLK